MPAAITLIDAPSQPPCLAAAVPEQTSGSDLREIVRRAVPSADETGLLSTAALLAEVGSGRYRATIPNGMYL